MNLSNISLSELESWMWLNGSLSSTCLNYLDSHFLFDSSTYLTESFDSINSIAELKSIIRGFLSIQTTIQET